MRGWGVCHGRADFGGLPMTAKEWAAIGAQIAAVWNGGPVPLGQAARRNIGRYAVELEASEPGTARGPFVVLRLGEATTTRAIDHATTEGVIDIDVYAPEGADVDGVPLAGEVIDQMIEAVRRSSRFLINEESRDGESDRQFPGYESEAASLEFTYHYRQGA